MGKVKKVNAKQENKSDKVLEKKSDKIVKTGSDKVLEKKSDKIVKNGSDKIKKKESDKIKKKESDKFKKMFKKPEEVDPNAFDLKKAKSEVLQFGLRGLKGEDKEKGLVDLLVSLGARPPKNKKIHYKELLNKKAVEKKQEAELRKSMEQFGGKLLKKKLPKVDDKKKRQGSELKFGRFKGGVMKVPVGIKSIAKQNGRKPY